MVPRDLLNKTKRNQRKVSHLDPLTIFRVLSLRKELRVDQLFLSDLHRVPTGHRVELLYIRCAGSPELRVLWGPCV